MGATAVVVIVVFGFHSTPPPIRGTRESTETPSPCPLCPGIRLMDTSWLLIDSLPRKRKGSLGATGNLVSLFASDTRQHLPQGGRENQLESAEPLSSIGMVIKREAIGSCFLLIWRNGKRSSGTQGVEVVVLLWLAKGTLETVGSSNMNLKRS